jgi:hypothetical protein
MLVLHANWTAGTLCVWGEEPGAYARLAERALEAGEARRRPRRDDSPVAVAEPAASLHHPFAVSAGALRSKLEEIGIMAADDAATPGTLGLRLPTGPRGPCPSDRLASMTADPAEDERESLETWTIPCLTLDPADVCGVLLRLESAGLDGGIELDHSLRYWIDVARFIVELLADQRFIPTVIQSGEAGGGAALRAGWRPWLHDEAARRRIGLLLSAMPPVARAVAEAEARPWPLLSSALACLTDALVREALAAEQFEDAIADRDPASDPTVAWLSGLLGSRAEVPGLADGHVLLQEARAWVARLDETGAGRAIRLCFRLSPPLELPLFDSVQPPDEAEARWPLTLHLRPADDPDWLIDVEKLWSDPAAAQLPDGGLLRHAEELVLAELGRASTLYPRLEASLRAARPASIDLSTEEAHQFLREFQPLLEESGFDVRAPAWWDGRASRLGIRLRIDAAGPGGAAGIGDERDWSETSDGDAAAEPAAGDSGLGSAGPSLLGLGSLVQYQWEVAVGEHRLSDADLERLSRAAAPLVRIGGAWVELSAADLAAATALCRQRPRGEMTLLEAIQLGHGGLPSKLGLPVLGLDAGGWAAAVLGASSDPQRMPRLPQPRGFHGSLRPYQQNGLSWLAFLDRFGFGACLADDMGLGKTIQLIALLLHEREPADGDAAAAERRAGDAAAVRAAPPPTLLIVPTSLVENWSRELARFAPSLRVLVRHGPDRPMGDPFVESVARADVVITTYALVTRDRETLARVLWRRVVLDEAQYIKNPPTKQTSAIRSLRAERRIALTGTPVENRLSELWSIMEFCNPGALGPAGEFRRRFAIPVERHRDRAQAERLRGLVRPFILRRLKTDPNVINDLPPCVETREYATLTPEQAALYQAIVSGMLAEIDRAEGMQRRGLVLAALMKLKQVCNHPAQLLKEELEPGRAAGPGSPAVEATSMSARSGKCRRLVTMLEEAVAAGDRALVFTQFRQMGHLLVAMLQHDLDCEALFLHGGTPQARRQQMIDRFQAAHGPPIFVLSLKAGGIGLNLTAANHVFHFDRWWNPAVENQATDRAFRIGQTRTVHVHKFVCVGTLEERIDQMIEQKTDLAQNIVGAGEDWLTEMSTRQLHDLLALRNTALEDDL